MCIQTLLKERNIGISELEKAYEKGGSKHLLAKQKSQPFVMRNKKERLAQGNSLEPSLR